jgi:hypothetical protein
MVDLTHQKETQTTDMQMFTFDDEETSPRL